MFAVYKYPVQMIEDFTVQAPEGALFLDAQVQNGQVQLWARVDTRRPMADYRFGVVGTGHPLNDFNARAPHIATFQLAGGDLVFHLFGGLYA